MIGHIVFDGELSASLRVYLSEGLICPDDASDAASRDYDRAILTDANEAISKRLNYARGTRFCVDVLDQGSDDNGHYAVVLIEAPLMEMTRIVRAFQ